MGGTAGIWPWQHASAKLILSKERHKKSGHLKWGCPLFLGLPESVFVFAIEIHHNRRCNANGTVGTNNNAHQQGKTKASNYFTTEDEDGQQHKKDGQGGVEGAAEGTVECEVDDR